MNLRPLLDVLVVPLEEVRRVSDGGIIVPDTDKVPIGYGLVLRAGPGMWVHNRAKKKEVFFKMQVKVGDRVVFHRANIQTKQGKGMVHYLGENTAIIRERDVLLVDEDSLVDATL